MMPFRSQAYIEAYDTDIYAGFLYTGEPFYFTRRGFPSGYDRLELFYEPDLSSFMKMRFSAVGHAIFPNSAVGSFLGWQARISLVFSLDKARKPQHPARKQSSPRSRNSQPRPGAPSIIL